jgi:hypothetical protein
VHQLIHHDRNPGANFAGNHDAAVGDERAHDIDHFNSSASARGTAALDLLAGCPRSANAQFATVPATTSNP